MVDGVIDSGALGATAPAAAPASTGATAAVAPVQTTTAPVDAVVAAPVVADAAPIIESKPVDAPKERTSLLGDAGAKPPVDEPSGQPTDATPATPEAAPASYDIVLPEGVQISDEKQFGEFKEVLKASGVDPSKAPELVAYVAREKATMEAASVQRQYDVWDQTNAEWQDQVMKDPVIGGDKWATVESQLGSIIDEFGKEIPTLRQTLNFTGAGNHPDVVKFLYNISEALKEGSIISGGKNANNGKPTSKAGRLYNGA